MANGGEGEGKEGKKGNEGKGGNDEKWVAATAEPV